MLIHLSLEIACLTDIAQWHPVGGLLQELALASRGDSGLSTTDIARLRQWARRWSKLSGSLNKFYRNRAGHSAVGAALWYLLDDRDLPSGPTVGKLKALWSEEHGVEPWIDLLPRFRG